MVEVAIEEMNGSDRTPTERLPASLGRQWRAHQRKPRRPLFAV